MGPDTIPGKPHEKPRTAFIPMTQPALNESPLHVWMPTDKIQPRSVSGRFAAWRWTLVWATQLLYYGLPWLTMNGRQAVLFDLEARRFFLFGAVLYPQDLIYLAGLLVVSALLLFFATALFGRVWCGFACPQSVYTAVFMWLEQRLEGSRTRRLQLDRSGWTAEKLLRRGGKHLAWGTLALWTGFTLVGYFTPIRDLAQGVATGQLGPWEAFWVGFYGLATYGNAGLLREKVCLHMCPYGRFQGSLMDAHTLNVAYDHRRGEPRQSKANGQAASHGACIDCTLCVQVCPTGIDIRQGLQAACIGCGLCVDACNGVMDRIQAPRGLIRLASLDELSRPLGMGTGPAHARPWDRPRVWAYGSLLLAACVCLALGFAQRPDLRMNVIRDRHVMARSVGQGDVENVYRVQLMNATETTRQVALEVNSRDGFQLPEPLVITLPPAAAQVVPVTVRLTQAQRAHRAIDAAVTPFTLEARDANHPDVSLARTESTFLAPRP